MVAWMDGIEWHILAAMRRDAAGRFRREAQQCFDCAAGPLTRTQFEHLAEQDEHGDDGGGLEIEGWLATVTCRWRERLRE